MAILNKVSNDIESSNSDNKHDGTLLSIKANILITNAIHTIPMNTKPFFSHSATSIDTLENPLAL